MASLAETLGLTSPDTSIFGNTGASSYPAGMYQPPSLMDLIRNPNDPMHSQIVWNAPQAPYAPYKAPSYMPMAAVIPPSPASTGVDVSSQGGGGDPNQNTSSQSQIGALGQVLGSILSPSTIAAINNIPGLQFQIPTTGYQQSQPPAARQGTGIGIDLPYTPPPGVTTPVSAADTPSQSHVVNVIENPSQIAAINAGGGGGSGGLFGPSGVAGQNVTQAPGSAFSQISVTPQQSLPDYSGLTGYYQGQTDSGGPSWQTILQQIAGNVAGAYAPGAGAALNAAVSAAPGLYQTAQGQQNLTQTPSSASWWSQLYNAPSEAGAYVSNLMSDLFGTGNTAYGQSSTGATAGPNDQVLSQSMQQGFGPNQQYSPSNNSFGIFGGSVDQSNPWGQGTFELLLPGQGGV